MIQRRREVAPQALQRRADRIIKDAEKLLDYVLSDIQQHHVKPYCDRHGCRFVAGMGSWHFEWPSGKFGYAEPFDCTDVRLPKRLLQVLTEPYPLNARYNSMGSLLNDYTPKGFKEAKEKHHANH